MKHDNDEFHNRALICRLARSLSWCLKAIDLLEPDDGDPTPGYCEARNALRAVTEEHGTGWEAGKDG